MLCYSFRGSLGLTEKEDVELRVAEAEKGVELTIEDVVGVLGGDGKMGRWANCRYDMIRIRRAERDQTPECGREMRLKESCSFIFQICK
jgi:hypothetical protein